jgi:stage III sporulation protein AB
MATELRLIAGLCLVIASYLLGQSLARRILTRLEDLYSFAHALTILSTEIGYSATPLPEALRRAGRTVGGHACEVFQAVSQHLEQTTGAWAQATDATVERAWAQALEHGETRLGIPPEDLTFVAELGSTLGRSDRQDQVAQLGRASRQLDSLARRLAPECEKNARLSRTLGLLGGLAAAILVL